MPVRHHSVFAGWMPFLPPNQQHQSTEDTAFYQLPKNNQNTAGIQINKNKNKSNRYCKYLPCIYLFLSIIIAGPEIR